LVALPLLFWDMLAGERKFRFRLLAWAAMASILAIQIWLHARLDQNLDPASFSVKDQGRFEVEHGIYVPISKFQDVGHDGSGSQNGWASKQSRRRAARQSGRIQARRRGSLRDANFASLNLPLGRP
jgi:hypothetical protein